MHDVLDIIRNVQTLYAVGPTLGILKDFERVVDELDVYVFTNWEDGELLSGPVDSRHFVTCSFMWPVDSHTKKSTLSHQPKNFGTLEGVNGIFKKGTLVKIVFLLGEAVITKIQ